MMPSIDNPICPDCKFPFVRTRRTKKRCRGCAWEKIKLYHKNYYKKVCELKKLNKEYKNTFQKYMNADDTKLMVKLTNKLSEIAKLIEKNLFE